MREGHSTVPSNDIRGIAAASMTRSSTEHTDRRGSLRSTPHSDWQSPSHPRTTVAGLSSTRCQQGAPLRGPMDSCLPSVKYGRDFLPSKMPSRYASIWDCHPVKFVARPAPAAKAGRARAASTRLTKTAGFLPSQFIAPEMVLKAYVSYRSSAST